MLEKVSVRGGPTRGSFVCGAFVAAGAAGVRQTDVCVWVGTSALGLREVKGVVDDVGRRGLAWLRTGDDV